MGVLRKIAEKILGTGLDKVDSANIVAQNILMGKILASNAASKGIVEDIAEVEFKVFSQWGDDGIIQYLIRNVDVSNEVFIEFGVESYVESNTRFLLMNNNWRGLVIDGGEDNIDYIRKDDIYWRYDLTAVQAFITSENINNLFTDNGFSGKIGLLSVDIDGNDYYVWDSINVVDPDIVVAEYNSVFGPDHAISVPYDPAFVRGKAHSSNLFWGCSLQALCRLAEKKDFAFVGCNSNGNNAYFVKREKLANLRELNAGEGFVDSKFRESRDDQGNLTYTGGKDRIELIKECVVYNVDEGKEMRIAELN